MAKGYADAVVVTGKVAFVSGQVPLDEEGNLVGPGDLRAQTAQAMRNLERIVKELGASWHDVAKLGTLVEVKGLFRPDILVEVDAIVAVPG